MNYGPYLTIEEQIALKPHTTKKSSERQTNEINFHSHNSILSSLKIATQKVFFFDGAKKKAHDPTTQIGRLLKNAISVIIVGRKKT